MNTSNCVDCGCSFEHAFSKAPLRCTECIKKRHAKRSRDEYAAKGIEERKRNPDYHREWYRLKTNFYNKEKKKKSGYDKDRAHRYYLKLKEKGYHKAYRIKSLSIPQNLMGVRLRIRIWCLLKRGPIKKEKHFRLIPVLGCSLDFLKKHLEQQFTEGMTWENYGRYGWWIDHILPCSSFDLADPEEQKKCFHYTNLQPLWYIDNLRKSNKIL